MHESNGLGIITALILNDINPLGMTRMDLVLELKNNASKLLLAIMESRTSGELKFIGSTTPMPKNDTLKRDCNFPDSEMNVAEKIIYNLNPKQLLDLACKFYHHQQVWPLTQFFLFPFCENSLICPPGKSMSFHKKETEKK